MEHDGESDNAALRHDAMIERLRCELVEFRVASIDNKSLCDKAFSRDRLPCKVRILLGLHFAMQEGELAHLAGSVVVRNSVGSARFRSGRDKRWGSRTWSPRAPIRETGHDEESIASLWFVGFVRSRHKRPPFQAPHQAARSGAIGGSAAVARRAWARRRP